MGALIKLKLHRLVWAILLCCSAPLAAQGQSSEAGDAGAESPLHQLRVEQPLSDAAIRNLVARLDDAQVRELLLEQLDARMTPGVPQVAFDMGSVLLQWRDSAEDLREGLGGLAEAIPELPDGLAGAFARLPEGGSLRVLLMISAGMALMLAVGWIAERLSRRFLRRLWLQAVEGPSEGPLTRLGCLLLGLAMEFVFLAVFVVGALAVFVALWQGNEVTRTVVMTYVTAVVAVRLYVVFSHFLLAPYHPNLRLVQMDNQATRFLHRQNIVMASIAAFGFLTCTLLRQLGLPDGVYRLLAFAVGFILFATLVYTILKARKAIAGDLAGQGAASGRFRLLIATAWPGITAAYVVLLYLVIVIVVFTGHPVSYLSVFGSLLAVIFVPHIDAVLERAAQHLEGVGEKVEQAGGQFRIVALRAGRIVLYVAAAMFLMRIWGLDLFSMAERSVGSRIAEALVDIGLTALVAYVLWEMARIAIDRRLAKEARELGQVAAESGEQGGQGVSRLRTLLPLLRVAAQVTIAVMSVMVVLSALGVDIGPLLAGAGVVGIAVGFGAQTLVRDIVSGVFFLVDDAFRLGEYIDVGAAKGTVEKISLRSLRLRHHRGALHTVPFGEIHHLTNYSRDWAIMKLEFRVPFDTDLDKVRKIFKQIGQDLMKDPELGPDFLEPFKSQGVLQTDDSAFVVRGKFMAKPGRQFVIRRVVFQAVQKAFAADDIHFADRRVTVHVPGAEAMTPEERSAVERGAASAVAAAEAKAQATKV
ncbi:MAG: mechanosensitive ion channel family protein [Kiloniellaceae bacterium]